MCVLENDDEIASFYGGEKKTTNNRMEILATINATQWTIDNGLTDVDIYGDSVYVIKGCNDYINHGKKRKTNLDLWNWLYNLLDKSDNNYIWIRGHDNNIGNERADELANIGRLNEVI